jgi:tRNA1Val (adenine37-N6)-methyltransferase
MKSSTSKTKGFEFKQFTIQDGDSGMPVSTDGVLLGAWANFDRTQRLLDIGTGTGLLTLMCAQRFSTASILAIDINQEAINDATRNVSQSSWTDRIEVKQQNVLSLNAPEGFDAIICNPPYFNSGERAAREQRAIARHSITLSHQELLDKCSQLLSVHGQACFVLPVTEGQEFINYALRTGWFLARCCNVRTTGKKPATRMLFTLQKRACSTEHQELVIHDEISGYSKAFIQLTQDFYLKM